MRFILRFFAIIFAIIGTYLLLLSYVFFAKRFECVVLPNGLLIGRTTVFSEFANRGQPEFAIKYPDGRIIRRGDWSINFYDYEAVGGSFPGDANGRPNQFIYVKVVGLIVESQQPIRFQYYWDKKKKGSPDTARKPNYSTRKIGHSKQKSEELKDTWRWADGASSNLGLVHLILEADRRNRRWWCPTAWYLP
ncbi:MAG: hypothetical protein ABJM29_02285 [Rhizobiaceae bacterium]